jgi:DNA-binding NarL/FixJ family response regulator
MRAGANGYVLKSVSTSELVRIIRCFCQGQSIISPYLVNLTLDLKEKDESAGTTEVELTEREREILKWITDGKSNKEISDSLFVSVETVKSHVKNLYKKLNVKNRVEAAMKGKGGSTL